jgi:hypothetical protein
MKRTQVNLSFQRSGRAASRIGKKGLRALSESFLLALGYKFDNVYVRIDCQSR